MDAGVDACMSSKTSSCSMHRSGTAQQNLRRMLSRRPFQKTKSAQPRHWVCWQSLQRMPFLLRHERQDMRPTCSEKCENPTESLSGSLSPCAHHTEAISLLSIGEPSMRCTIERVFWSERRCTTSISQALPIIRRRVHPALRSPCPSQTTSRRWSRCW